MRELFSENEQLAVRNFQALRRRGGFGRAQQSQFSLKCVRLACFCFCGLSRFYHIDPNRDALLRFNLMDCNGAICAVEHPFNQTALRIARTISKLWHRRGKIVGNVESQNLIWWNALSSTRWNDYRHAKIFLSSFCNLIRLRDMKCAAAITIVCIAFVSQALALLRPLFPAKADPPFNSETINTGNGSIQHPAKRPFNTAPR
jgi:hypothetical protein